MSINEQEPDEQTPRFGWPIKIAVIWSVLVTLGCFLMLMVYEYPEVKGTENFVVLVRNVALIGAAAIALPVSLYTFWMKDRAFRVDFRRAVREEADRRARIEREAVAQHEANELARKVSRDQGVGDKGMRPIIQYIADNGGCTTDDIAKFLQEYDLPQIEALVEQSWRNGLVTGVTQEDLLDGPILNFGFLFVTWAGTRWLERTSV